MLNEPALKPVQSCIAGNSHIESLATFGEEMYTD